MSHPPPLLALDNIQITFNTDEGGLTAVDGVSFELHAGEMLGLVGESGCGKSITCKSIMGLLPTPNGHLSAGAIRFKGEDLAKASPRRMREVRGDDIGMIFQDPMTALNPVLTVGFQIMEAIAQHRRMPRQEQRALAIEILERVGIPSPHTRIDDYPHQLSGGMRQRVMIAMALALNPGVLIADEPTTALDVTIQAQILALMNQLRKDQNTGVLLITHDLGVVAEVCDRVVVMYAGKVVEVGTVEEIFHSPSHPYTIRLLDSIPKAGSRKAGQRQERLATIPGRVPDLRELPKGCRFQARCHKVDPLCAQSEPELRPWEQNPGQLTRCHFPGTPREPSA